MHTFVVWMERWQVALYLGAIVIGAAAGLLLPDTAPTLAATITPALGLLLFATFLGVPLVDVTRSLRDGRFLATVLLVNFLVVPAIVWVLTRPIAGNQGLLVGVLLVLLTPCVDYVIVFTGLAGGDKARLLAATPLLMLLQLLLLPAYLWLFAGTETAGLIEVQPFAEAFLFLIVLPLVAAAAVQSAARRFAAARRLSAVMAGAMVPLMVVTLAAVVGSQIVGLGGEVATLAGLVPIYLIFLALTLAVGIGAAEMAKLDVAASRAVTFSAATRNSLVVLPLALAVPPSLGLAPLAVVTQTLVELVGMVVFVRLVPWLIPNRAITPTAEGAPKPGVPA